MKLVYNITHLDEAGLAEAGSILDAAFGRNGMEGPLRQVYALQPQNWLCARRCEPQCDGEMIALVGAYNYGSFASIGMMAVVPAAQRQGVGEAVMVEVGRFLEEHGCPTMLLDASAAGQHLYPRLGFLAEGETLRMAQTGVDRGCAPAAAGLIVGPFAEESLPEVVAFDALLFGAERGQILAAYRATDPSRAFVVRDAAGALAGYLLASGNHIGPWTATTLEAAEALLPAALALPFTSPPFVTIPSENAGGVELLARRGFAVTERLLHMRRGGAGDPRRVGCLYSQASLTLG
jgi:GNAT superfamily N-acetyltransferase